MSKISIIGSGSFGTAMAISTALAGHNVTLYSRRREMTEELMSNHENARYLPGARLPDSINFTSDLEDTRGSDITVIAIPSHTVKDTATLLSPFVECGGIVLNISKGFAEEDEPIRLSEILKAAIPQAKIAVMSGPSHAEEVAIGLPTTNVVAACDYNTSKLIQEVFSTKSFRIYTSDDIIGLEIGGALKNIIALCAGISDGLGYGDNAKAAIITRGIAEISRLGVAIGAKKETFSGLSGIGDLVVTCTSMHSRNRRAGILIGQGRSADDAAKSIGMVVEGIKAAKAAHILGARYGVEMPITDEAYKVIYEGENVKECLTRLMSRDMKPEI